MVLAAETDCRWIESSPLWQASIERGMLVLKAIPEKTLLSIKSTNGQPVANDIALLLGILFGVTFITIAVMITVSYIRGTLPKLPASNPAQSKAEKGCIILAKGVTETLTGQSRQPVSVTSSLESDKYHVWVNLGIVRGERLAARCIADSTGKIVDIQPGTW